MLKKNTEDYRVKSEKLQQNVENIRQEREAELSVLRDAVARLQAELLERDRVLEHLKVGIIPIQGAPHLAC